MGILKKTLSTMIRLFAEQEQKHQAHINTLTHLNDCLKDKINGTLQKLRQQNITVARESNIDEQIKEHEEHSEELAARENCKYIINVTQYDQSNKPHKSILSNLFFLSDGTDYKTITNGTTADVFLFANKETAQKMVEYLKDLAKRKGDYSEFEAARF